MLKNYSHYSAQAFRLHTFFMGNKKFCLASGGGGCGKSFAIASWLKNSGLDSTEYVFVAPTGKAVSVAEEKGMHGRTIHSYFKLLNNDTHHNIDRHIISKWGSFDKYTVEMKKELFDKKVIIIDEISMVNNQMLNFILELIQQVAPSAKIILSGDYHQLGAVIPNAKRENNPGIDESLGLVFDMINSGGVDVIDFNTRYRSNDEVYNEWLHNLRHMMDPSLRDVEKLATAIESFFNVHQNNVPENIETHLTYLCYTNAKVKEINDHILNILNGNQLPKISKAIIYVDDVRHTTIGDVRNSNAQQILREMQFVEQVPIVVGATVLFLTNGEKYRNGDSGTIYEIKGSSVVVKKHSPAGNYMVEIDKHKYESSPYEKSIGLNVTVTQWPFTLAYARSIHKSQGDGFTDLHLDFTEFLDNKNLTKYDKWRLLYVCISRVKDPSKVWIGRASLDKLRANRKLLSDIDFDKLSLNFSKADKQKYIPRNV